MTLFRTGVAVCQQHGGKQCNAGEKLMKNTFFQYTCTAERQRVCKSRVRIRQDDRIMSRARLRPVSFAGPGPGPASVWRAPVTRGAAAQQSRLHPLCHAHHEAANPAENPAAAAARRFGPNNRVADASQTRSLARHQTTNTPPATITNHRKSGSSACRRAAPIPDRPCRTGAICSGI